MIEGIYLSDSHMAILMRHARSIPDDDLRGAYFKHCADLLRPHLHRDLTDRDIYRAAAEAFRRIGASE
jgi:hypothetical protein